MTESRLDRMVTELRDYAGELETELKRVRRALAALDETEPADSQRPETSTINLVMQVFRDNPDRVLTATETHALMEDRGWVSESKDPINVVRTALARLAASDELERVEGRGRYRLADTVDDDDKPNSEPTADDYGSDPWASPPPPQPPAATPMRNFDDDEPPF
ncbi:MAG: hypothetical protein M3Q39_04460 [Actinomycetota bacterium]|nr:hypothetical protein [Actinomycetota bacterium]